eukprot:CAMPEP_0198219528 /NCGR_PEP_ID=MMETSP1445-20131203/74813_1 /TAXON_ID=36898 /ORGANISM="Pyramimonas sp., Strain CCMP2087" /LENGTH=90 /DNA_ID=CAMNT_0043896959 /DNA_START=19 /DNA_END=288 /DNA_ORIENTATION=+
MSTATETEEECLSPSCQNKGSLQCSACKVVRFCSLECQKEVWKAHKHLCKSLQQAETAAPTNEQSSCLILVGMGALGSDDLNTRPIQASL